jgi:cell division protein ftsX
MKHLYNQHIDAMYTSLVGFKRAPLSSFLLILMLAIALSLPLALYLSTRQIEIVLEKMPVNPHLSIFMASNTNSQEISRTALYLQNDPLIRSVQYVDKEEALKHLAEQLQEKDLLNQLEKNPLPDAFVITAVQDDPDTINSLARSLRNLPQVEHVQMDSKVIKTFYAFKQFGQHLALLLAMILSFSFILLSHNMIQLHILNAADKIEIMHLIGASRAFIKRPFLYEALWQALCTVLLGIMLSTFWVHQVIKALQPILADYALNLNSNASVFFNLPQLLAITLSVTVLFLLGANWAAQQFLYRFQKNC